MKQYILVASLLVSASAFAHDVDPNGFEKQHFTSSVSRTEVIDRAKAKTQTSIRIDDQGRAITTPSTKSRAEVNAEMREAARFGLMRNGEVGAVPATAAQEEQINLAGQRASHSASSD
jgi:GTP-dependent phosphoenolpyruvate carboxykinase